MTRRRNFRLTTFHKRMKSWCGEPCVFIRNRLESRTLMLGGAISVIFGSQASLRVHCCKRDEVYFTTLLWRNNGRQNGLIISRMLFFRIWQNHGEWSYLGRFYGGRSPLLDPHLHERHACSQPTGENAFYRLLGKLHLRNSYKENLLAELPSSQIEQSALWAKSLREMIKPSSAKSAGRFTTLAPWCHWHGWLCSTIDIIAMQREGKWSGGRKMSSKVTVASIVDCVELVRESGQLAELRECCSALISKLPTSLCSTSRQFDEACMGIGRMFSMGWLIVDFWKGALGGRKYVFEGFQQRWNCILLTPKLRQKHCSSNTLTTTYQFQSLGH